MFSLRSPQAEATISRISLFMALQSQTLSFLRKARDPKHPFNPAYIFRRAFFARKYALGTTGFTVILRATGRICAIFNETFALTFATAVSFSLDNHN